jgi:Na+/H+-dicarboxylate symporter
MKILGIWSILVFEAVFIGFSGWLIYVALRDWSHMNGWVHMGDVFIISPAMIFLPLILFLLPLQLAYAENRKERKVRIASFAVWTLVASGIAHFIITASSNVTSGC